MAKNIRKTGLKRPESTPGSESGKENNAKKGVLLRKQPSKAFKKALEAVAEMEKEKFN